DAYKASLPARDRQDLESQESRQAGAPPADVPRVLAELLSFPYVVGPPFTRALLQSRGQQGLDQAFRSRPAASSEVLHPDRFLGGDAPAGVASPAADGPTFDQGTLGEFGYDLVLEDMVRSGESTSAGLRSATAGWAGDRYVAWSRPGGYCVRD